MLRLLPAVPQAPPTQPVQTQPCPLILAQSLRDLDQGPLVGQAGLHLSFPPVRPKAPY